MRIMWTFQINKSNLIHTLYMKKSKIIILFFAFIIICRRSLFRLFLFLFVFNCVCIDIFLFSIRIMCMCVYIDKFELIIILISILHKKMWVELNIKESIQHIVHAPFTLFRALRFKILKSNVANFIKLFQIERKKRKNNVNRKWIIFNVNCWK